MLAISHVAVAEPKHAYVSVLDLHGDYPDESLLAVRVLLSSLRPLTHPFIVIAEETIPAATDVLLKEAGATVMKVGSEWSRLNIPEYESFFILHAWGLTE